MIGMQQSGAAREGSGLFLWLASRGRKPPWRPLAAMLVAAAAAGARLVWVAARTPGSGLRPAPELDYLWHQSAAVLGEAVLL